jgi:hypothetical protein
MAYKALQVVSILLLLLAVIDLPYDYYTLLRFVICPVAAYGAYIGSKAKKTFWLWSLGACALLFNPIAKVHLGRETWSYLNLIAAGLIFASLFAISTKHLDSQDKS